MDESITKELESLKQKVAELEKKLKWSESFLNEILGMTNVIVVHLDLNGNVVLINKAVERITGYASDEIIGKNWFSTLVPKERYPHVWQLFESFKAKGEVVEHFENPILTKDGEERIISWRNSTLKRDNEIIGTLSFGIDITESLYILDQFVDQQRSYKALIDNLPGIIYRCKNDESYTMVRISDKCFNITGYKSEDFISKKISFGELILDEDKKSIQKQIDEAISLNKPFQITYRIKTKDGNIKWLWEQGISILDENNTYLEGYIIDITEKIKAEEQLELQREFFKQLFENSPIGIVILDKYDKIIDVNEAFQKLFYFNREEVIGLSINQLIVPPDLKSEGLNLSNKVLNDEVVITETKRMRKDGTLVDVLVIGYPILHKGERVGIFGMYKDITEQKKVYEMLKQEKEKIEELNQLKSSFLFNISHEIRTPLNSILGFSDLLIGELADSQLNDLKEFAESIKRGGIRLLNLMDNIIEISLIESSKTELNLEKLNVIMVLDPVVNSFESVASEKKLTIEKDYQSDFEILTDAKRLALVFRNILDNAFKFTDRGGVKVRTYKKSESDTRSLGVIEIIDTGIGISEKFMAKLFEPFTQESTGLNREYEGIGLGLNLSKRLIEILNGKIEIESKSEKGTKVRIIFNLED